MDDERLRWGSIAKQNFTILSPDIRGGAAVPERSGGMERVAEPRLAGLAVDLLRNFLNGYAPKKIRKINKNL